MIKIRPIRQDDAEAFLAMLQMLDNETKFMMYEPGERKTTVADMHERITKLLSTDNRIIFVAEDDNWLVGFLQAMGGTYRRNRHCLHIVIGIIKEFRGRGVGKHLFMEMERWAREKGMHRLELTVMTNNERGIRLYQTIGFEIEGTRMHSLLVDGEYIDEFTMFKLLE